MAIVKATVGEYVSTSALRASAEYYSHGKRPSHIGRRPPADFDRQEIIGTGEIDSASTTRARICGTCVCLAILAR